MSDRLNHRVPSYLYFFNEGERRWGFPDPSDPKLRESSHTARYYPERLSKEDAMRLSTFVDACLYLLVDCSTTGRAIEQLRAIRNAVKETDDE